LHHLPLQLNGMNVVHAVEWFFPDTLGGTEVYVAALAARLAAAGHATSIIAPRVGGRQVQEYIHDGIRVFRYPIPATLTRAEAQGRIRARGAGEFDRIVGHLRPDIVHFHTFGSGLGIGELKGARDVSAAVVATNHLPSLGYVCQRGTLMRWGESACDGVCRPLKCASCELQNRGLPRAAAAAVGLLGFAFRGREGALPQGRLASSLLMTDLIYYNQEKQAELISLLDRFVLLNQVALKMVLANGAEPRKLVLNRLGSSHVNGRRKPLPEQSPTQSPIRIGYVGRLVETKGVLDLARAVASVPRSLPFTIELRGPADDKESVELLRRLRQIAGDDARLLVRPPIATADIPSLMASFDVLVVPSIWFENGPTVVSEAHAAGTPVIGTTIGAMPELITHDVDGLLLEPGDWRALAVAIRRMVKDPASTIDKWRRHVPEARTMRDIAEDYLEMYMAVLAENRMTTAQAGIRH
jgi:glycosyltransferase involved in cell wall biosynthesis